MIDYIIDPHPSDTELRALWLAAWGNAGPRNFQTILSRSLTHIGAYQDSGLIGFVNVAWDGGIHAFILDTCVHPDLRRQGIATEMVKLATDTARARNAVCCCSNFEQATLAKSQIDTVWCSWPDVISFVFAWKLLGFIERGPHRRI
jgi:ribosomal protein S18 acetylase RimI-like enzyme